MIRLIEDNRAAIEQVCRTHGVDQLELFGSAARADFDEVTSDVDFLVRFLPRDSGQAEAFFGLREDLERLLGRPIDLVMTDAVRNRYFREAIERDRVPLYAHAA